MKRIFSFFTILFAVCAIHAQTTITDDFESYADFTVNPSGQWTFADEDGDSTYGYQGITFANMGGEMAFIVFNPSQTSPATPMQPHSGNKFLATFASTTTANNDWIISGNLGSHGGAILTFWACSSTDEYGLERFKVGYSTTTNSTSAFTFIQNGNYVEAPTEWTQYSYMIPGNAKYVAINCVSNDAFIFMLDDISIEFPTEPMLEASPNSVDFGNVVLGNDKTTTIHIGAVSLEGDITATTSAPFEISLDGTTYGLSTTINTFGGTLYVKYDPTVAGSASEDLTLSTTGLTDVIIPLTGNAVECNTITTFPYFCGFESTEETSSCWESIDVAMDGNNGLDEFTSAQDEEGNTWMVFFHSGNGAEDWLISPEFEIGENMHATFEYFVGSISFFGLLIPIPETFSVWAIPEGSSVDDAINLVPAEPRGNGYVQRLNADLSEYANQTIRIGIKLITPMEEGNLLAVDNFEIKTIVPALTLLTADAMDFFNVRVGGNQQQIASFEGFGISDPITVTATGDFTVSLDGSSFTSSISVPGDTILTFERDFYIQFSPSSAGNKTGTATLSSVNMATGEEIEISLTGTGIECNDVINTFPYSADFSDYPCWTVMDDNEDGSTFGFGDGFAGYTYSVGNAANDWLISPEISVNDAELTVQVAYSCRSTTYPEKFSVWVITDLNDHTGGTKIMGPVDVTSTEISYTTFAELRDFHNQNIHIGIKAESDANMYTLYIDGLYIQSGVGVDETTVDNTVNVYPNPASSILNITSSSLISQVEMFNMAGQLIHKTESTDNNLQINTADFAQGFYFVKIHNENGMTTKKVSIVK